MLFYCFLCKTYLDLRTGCQTSDVQGVMDGDLDALISAWLKGGQPRQRKQGVTDED